MLDARERRAQAQKELLLHADGNACLVSLSLNIAGSVKRTPKTRLLFDRAMKVFESFGFQEISRLATDEITGTEALILLNADPSSVKRSLERLEDSFPAGRLLDFDVLNASGEKLSRAIPRRCLVCDGPAAVCARSRAHGLDAVLRAAESLLDGFAADTLAYTAHFALIRELRTTPKPGLVDEMNNGAHTDMDIPLFEKSAASLVPYFRQAALAGIADAGMETLKARGLDAEKAMFSATGGVNTHKGMIYSMGLLLYGMGRALETGSDAREAAAELARTDAAARLSDAARLKGTNGGAVYAKTGAKGAIGEAAEGFPHAAACAGRLRHYASVGSSEPGALALCDTMAVLSDTNVLHRGGQEGLAFVQAEAGRISSLPVSDRVGALTELDNELIRRNLSPGGSADILALAYLLNAWEELSAHLFSPEDSL